MNLSKRNEAQVLGAWGEQRACEFLEQMGMFLIERNFHVREGEIDLVMEDSGTLVFVEVKTRASLLFGTPEDSIHKKKLMRLYKAAHAYLEIQEDPELDWRIDIVAIECTSDRILKRIDHYPNIALMEDRG